jgi:branched-chain amino acid transport system permease protein
MQKTQRLPLGGLRATLAERFEDYRIPIPMLILVALAAIVPLFVKDEYILRLLTSVLLFGAEAMVFDFTAGYINAVNFGFAAFLGIGAYMAAVLRTRLGIDPWTAMVAGAAAAAVVGFITGILTLRQRGIYVSLMAWFVGLGMMAVVTALVDVTRGAWGMNVPPLYPDITARAQVYIMLGLLVFIYLVLHTVVRSNVGLAFRGIGQNFDAARASGINPTKYKVLNFTLSCALAGLLGGFYGPYVGILTPSVMGTSYTIEILTLCYVGGRATLWGGLLASFIFIPVFDYLKKLMELRLIIYGVALISVMIFYPAGMAGLIDKLSSWLRTKIKGAPKA